MPDRLRAILTRGARLWRDRSGGSIGKPAIPPVTLVGFPFAVTGRAEHVRAMWRAFRAAGIAASLHDISGGPVPDGATFTQLAAALSPKLGEGIRIFSLNGDEADVGHELIERRRPGAFAAGYNIIFPAWELPRYPAVWARALERYDEVWTASAFADASIRPAVTVPVRHIPNACEPHVAAPLDREHFGLPADSFVILVFFDLWSYTSRKNPWAAIEAFRKVLAARPQAPVHLAIKLNHASHDAKVSAAIAEAVAGLGDHATLIADQMPDNEMKNLVRCCDCLLSLHRSEGFGRGPAEAMFLGKPAVATGWSGNMEYMNHEVSFPVAYRLIPVGHGEYPHWQDQLWADPDIDDAAAILVRLVDRPALVKAVGERAARHMRRNFSDRVLGLRYRDRILDLAGNGESL